MKKKRFTRKDFVYNLFNNSEWSFNSKAEVERILNLFIKEFQLSLATDHVIEIRGIGTFSVKTIPAREQAWKLNKDRLLWENNHPEDRIKFSECISVRFKPSSTLRKIIKEALNSITEEAKRMSKKDLIN